MSADPRPLVHDWGTKAAHRSLSQPVTVQDETLREGLQSPTVADPPLSAKLELLHLMAQLGIDSASLGIPAAGPRQRETVRALCAEIAARRLPVRPNCGGRTLVEDVGRIAEVRDATGVDLEACLFLGSSPIRQLVEDWSLAGMVRHTETSVGFAVGAGLRVTYVTEDTTRSTPEHLRPLLQAAVHAGAQRVCLCDTVGVATPAGARNLVSWVRDLLGDAAEIGIDWHGHNDRGLGVANALAAIEAGADRIHATGLGLGERVGNTEMEALLVNLALLGLRDHDLRALPRYCACIAEATGVPIPARAPVVGSDAFRTATGVHAAAVHKARAKGELELADRVYSAFPAAWVGRCQEIAIGPMSGAANVRACLAERGQAPSEELIRGVLGHARRLGRVLRDAELDDLLRQIDGGAGDA